MDDERVWPQRGGLRGWTGSLKTRLIYISRFLDALVGDVSVSTPPCALERGERGLPLLGAVC